MNMKADSPHKGRLGAAWDLPGWGVLLLAGLLCTGTLQAQEKNGTPVPPESSLLANDSVGQRFDRLFRPRVYWLAKVAELEARVEISRQNFVASDQAYRAFLRQRREAMQKTRGTVKAGQPNPQRREVLLSFREESARLRQTNREAQKILRQEMIWLEFARRALEQAR